MAHDAVVCGHRSFSYKITKSDGEPIADAKDDQVAQDISDRLNADHDREEEDRWA